MYLLAASVAAVLALNAAAGSAQGTCLVGDVSVSVGPNNTNTFNPDPVTINAGQTICWSWASVAIPHSSTSTADGGWDSGVHTAPHAFRRQFSNAGSFVYFCSVHAEMTGTVNVNPPTAVGVTAFVAVRAASGVVIRWRVVAHARTVAFRLFRAHAGGTRVRLTGTPILRRQPPTSGSYSFVDRRAPGGTLRYWLQAVDSSGTTRWFGPAVVAPA